MTLKQWSFNDSHSPKSQKHKIDELPRIQPFSHDWDWKDLLPCYQKRYDYDLKPVKRLKECDIPEDCSCPRCNAPFIIT